MTKTAITLHPCGHQADDGPLDLNAPMCGNPATHVCSYGPWTFGSCDEHPCIVHAENVREADRG